MKVDTATLANIIECAVYWYRRCRRIERRLEQLRQFDDGPRCVLCETPIDSCELCEDCARGNDPFAGEIQETWSDRADLRGDLDT